MNIFAPFQKLNTTFIVKNIIQDSTKFKTIKIFNYPIPVGKERDLLDIPGVGEADIRASLLKGELLHKLIYKEIEIVQSDIDLLQFNSSQLAFLESNGISFGSRISDSNFKYVQMTNKQLVGIADGYNSIFISPDPYFIITNTNDIVVYRNGVRQAFNDDYMIAESGGPVTGYNTIIFNNPPLSGDLIVADYYIPNS
jgi:hypothetical protein